MEDAMADYAWSDLVDGTAMLAHTNTKVLGREVSYRSLIEPGDYSVARKEVWAGTLYSVSFIGLPPERHRWFILRSPFGHGYWCSTDRRRFTSRFGRFSEQESLYEIGFSLQPFWFAELDDAEAAILSMHGVLHPRYVDCLGERGKWLIQWVSSPQEHFNAMFVRPIAGGWIEPNAEERIAMAAEQNAQHKEETEE